MIGDVLAWFVAFAFLAVVINEVRDHRDGSRWRTRPHPAKQDQTDVNSGRHQRVWVYDHGSAP